MYRGANVTLQSKDGRTALHEAAEGDHLEIVHELLENGANPLVSAEGYRPHDLARKDYGQVYYGFCYTLMYSALYIAIVCLCTGCRSTRGKNAPEVHSLHSYQVNSSSIKSGFSEIQTRWSTYGKN